MKFFKENFTDFLETTTVHGLVYLTIRNSKCTRLIWLFIVITASIFAGYFLTETVSGFNTKFTSTTIETRDKIEYGVSFKIEKVIALISAAIDQY